MAATRVVSRGEVGNLYAARSTVLEMLGDRGYIVLEDPSKQTPDDFRADFFKHDSKRSVCAMIAVHSGDPSDVIYVFFPDEPRGLGVKALAGIVQKMRDEDVQRCILVLRSGLTPFAKQAVRDVVDSSFHIETFDEDELLFNVTKHALVPHHRVLTAGEKLVLLAKYKVREGNLPRISVNDPVARYYGLHVGQVVKIIRASETAGRYITYRIGAPVLLMKGSPTQRFW